jgi:F-box protein 36
MESVGETVAWKQAVKRSRKIFEATGQVPAPSKDFCQILVTEGGVIWRKWRITLRNVSQGAAPMPTEQVMTYEDFQLDKSLQFEVELIFGMKALNSINRALKGHHDPLSNLPEDVMIKIISFLDLQSISYLSQVDQYLRYICGIDKLWEQLYMIHQGAPNNDVRSLAKELGWKQVFFMNKLQLQKEIFRKRRQQSSSMEPMELSSTFVTQQIED